jgi:hypothetical protein
VYAIPVGAYEQREAAIGCAAVVKIDHSHAPRGNGVVDAPHPVFDAERRGLHDHAERGYDQQVRVYAIPVGAHEQREAAIWRAAAVKTEHPVYLPHPIVGKPTPTAFGQNQQLREQAHSYRSGFTRLL